MTDRAPTPMRPRSDAPKVAQADDLRDFLLVVRRALLMVCRWIETRYP